MQPKINPYPLRVVAWEATRRCRLNCRHCRADAADSEFTGELSTMDAKNMLDGLVSFAKPMLILTGGEPMLREDIYELAAYAWKSGMKVVMASCGALINPVTAARMKEAGIQAVSISIDGMDAETHDAFRGISGAFETALAAMKHVKTAGLPFQINTTVSRLNAGQLRQIYDLAAGQGAAALDFFFLVPTGRGAALKGLVIDSETYEKTLDWIYKLSQNSSIAIKTTCAPHYARIQQQRAGGDYEKIPPRFRARNCMAGKGFIFISHRGIVQPCGFLDLACGNLKKENFDLMKIYGGSAVFNDLRNFEKYRGSCGKCRFIKTCGGCRARAFAENGDYLGSEPGCVMGTANSN